MSRKLTAAAMRDKLGVSIRTIERWIDAGILPRGIRINRGYRFWDEEEVDKALQSHTHK